MLGKILSWIDGPIVSRVIASIVGTILGIVAQHIALSVDQLAQFKDALTTIVTLIVYAFTHGAIKTASFDLGNPIAPPAGMSTAG